MTNVKRLIAIVCLAGILFSSASCGSREKGTVQPYNISLEINDKHYSGSPALREKESEKIFYPLEEIAAYFEDSLVKEGNTIIWKGDLQISPDEEDVILHDGMIYVSESFLTEKMGLALYVNYDGTRYLDDYPQLDYSWTKYRTVYHGCGGIDEYTYTNSREALLENYARGARVFEVDFELTSDGVPVCLHDWEMAYIRMDLPRAEVEKDGETILDYVPLTAEEFMKHKLHGQYTPMTFEDLLDIMQEKPDMYIITDTKTRDDPEVTEIFQALVDVAAKKDITLLDRVIPQMYINSMYDCLMRIYDWKSVVYTFYYYGGTFRYHDVYEYSRKHGIKAFALNDKRKDKLFINMMADRGGRFYMHTYNEMEEVEDLLKNDSIYGVYTDYLSPDCMDSIPYPYVLEAEETQD